MKKLQQYWVWLVIVILPLLYANNSLDPDIYLRFLGLSVCLLIPLIYCLKNIKTLQVVWDKLLFVYLAFLVWCFISIYFSRNTGDGVFEWLKILYGFVLLFLINIILKPWKLQNEIVNAFTVLSFVLSIAGLIDLFLILLKGNLIIPLSTYQVSPFYGHRNLYCQMLFFSFPFIVISSVYSKKSMWKVIGTASFVISTFVLIVLSNRATWIALAGGCVSLFIFHSIYYKKFRKELINKFFSNKLFYLVPIIILLSSAFFYLKFADMGTLEKHSAGLVEFDQGSTKDRLELWTRTLQLIKEKPVMGQGLSNWKIEMLKSGNKGLVSEDNNTFYQRPHNDFLWVMSETGLIGLLLYCAIFIIALVYLFRIIKNCNSYEDFLFYNIILVVGLGFMVYSFFSFPKERIESLIVVSLVLGLIISKHREIKVIKVLTKGISRFILIIILISLTVSMYIISSRYYSDIHMKKALIAKDKKNYPVVIKEIDQAISPYYPTDPFSTPLTWYRGSAWFNMNNTSLALKDFKAAYDINPYHIHVLNNLASAYELKGEHEKAIIYYKKAVTIAPNFEEAWLNLCAVYFDMGQTDSAYRALTHIDTGTKNPNYNKFLTVVLKARFSAIAESKPVLSKWVNLFNTDQEIYLKIHQYSVEHNVDIFNIFTDTLLLKSIFAH